MPLSIALINPPDVVARDGGAERGPPPLGLAYIASYLRNAGHTVALYDVAHLPGTAFQEMVPLGLLDAAVFGLTSYTKTFVAALDLARAIKSAKPGAVIVLGGPHASPCADDILARHGEIDFVVRRDGELPMAALVDAIEHSRDLADVPSLVWRRPASSGRLALSTIVANDPPSLPSLDELPHPARDFRIEPSRENFEQRGRSHAARVAFIVGSRGCPKRCTFCSIIVMNPRWHARSVPSLMAEIRELYARAPFGHVSFIDANSFVRSSRAREFSNALHAWNPAVTWSGTATADNVRKHRDVMFDIAKNCAFLEVGIESGSDSVLARFGKGTTVADNEAAVAILREARIGLDLDFIMFDAKTTLADLRDNIAFLHRNDFFGYHPTDHLYNALRLYPGTTAHDVAVRASGDREVELLPDFEYEEVASIFETMREFHRTFQGRIDIALSRLEVVIADMLGSSDLDHERLVDAQVLSIRLRHHPYRLVTKLVTLAQARAGALAARLDTPDIRLLVSEVDDLLDRARRLGVAEISTQPQEMYAG